MECKDYDIAYYLLALPITNICIMYTEPETHWLVTLVPLKNIMLIMHVVMDINAFCAGY